MMMESPEKQPDALRKTARRVEIGAALLLAVALAGVAVKNCVGTFFGDEPEKAGAWKKESFDKLSADPENHSADYPRFVAAPAAPPTPKPVVRPAQRTKNPPAARIAPEGTLPPFPPPKLQADVQHVRDLCNELYEEEPKIFTALEPSIMERLGRALSDLWEKTAEAGYDRSEAGWDRICTGSFAQVLERLQKLARMILASPLTQIEKYHALISLRGYSGSDYFFKGDALWTGMEDALIAAGLGRQNEEGRFFLAFGYGTPERVAQIKEFGREVMAVLQLLDLLQERREYLGKLLHRLRDDVQAMHQDPKLQAETGGMVDYEEFFGSGKENVSRTIRENYVKRKLQTMLEHFETMYHAEFDNPTIRSYASLPYASSGRAMWLRAKWGCAAFLDGILRIVRDNGVTPADTQSTYSWEELIQLSNELSRTEEEVNEYKAWEANRGLPEK